MDLSIVTVVSVDRTHASPKELATHTGHRPSLGLANHVGCRDLDRWGGAGEEVGEGVGDGVGEWVGGRVGEGVGEGVGDGVGAVIVVVVR